ncbi:MAG: hypothetical protein IPP42_22925 [Saprospiraceae bacterium]|nr:hypothetical protein [Saprospiraceae bacterium]
MGRSNIVGTPISVPLSRKAYLEMQQVTLALKSKISWIGGDHLEGGYHNCSLRATHFIKADVKDGAVVIDVGYGSNPQTQVLKKEPDWLEM